MIDNKQSIVLIGMPGCGKSTIGKMIAERLNMKFYDLDSYIEDREKCTIEEIFKFGELYFRDIEEAAVKEISKESSCVISTGGGVVLRESNITALKENGIIIFIDRPVAQIISDVDVSKRPLLKDGIEKIYKLYDERYDLYKKYCDLKIVNEGTIENVINKLLNLVDISCN